MMRISAVWAADRGPASVAHSPHDATGERGGSVLTAVIIALLLLGAVIYGLTKQSPNAPTSSRPLRTPTARPTTADAVHDPPPPQPLPPLEPWPIQVRQFEVAGEFYRLDNIARLFHGIRVDTPDGAELHHPARLVPDPGNPYDPNAVAVFVEGLHVGYVERADAASYHHPIAEATRQGHAVTVSSRQWARSRGPRDLAARVTLMLPAPHAFLPVNRLPPTAQLLAQGSTVQVTGEQGHMDVLWPLLERHGREVPLIATMHCVEQVRPRSTVKQVEVRVDGQSVGTLSPTQSKNYEALVCYLDENGHLPAAKAVLKGNQVKAEVTLSMLKPEDAHPSWLNSLRRLAP